jgi:ribosomal protein L25 (general stress protein Ctc)
MDNMIFGTLWYTVEAMNDDVEIRYNEFTHRDEKVTYYDVIKVDIDEEKQTGTVVIKDMKNNTIENWYWDKEIDIWCKE